MVLSSPCRRLAQPTRQMPHLCRSGTASAAVAVFQKRMQRSAVPPPLASRPCWWGDHAIALTAAVWSLNLQHGAGGVQAPDVQLVVVAARGHLPVVRGPLQAAHLIRQSTRVVSIGCASWLTTVPSNDCTNLPSCTSPLPLADEH